MDVSSLSPVRKLDIDLLSQVLNNENLSSADKQKESSEIQLLPEIFRLLASLEDDTQKMLLENWAKMNMPLNENTVKRLLNYLNSNPAQNRADKLAVIKAFAFLEKSGLPHTKKIVDALRSFFNDGNLKDSLNEIFSKNENFSSLQIKNLFQGLDNERLKENLNKLILNKPSSDLTNSSKETASNQTEVTETSIKTESNLKSEIESGSKNISKINESYHKMLQSLGINDKEINSPLIKELNLNAIFKNFNEKTLNALNNFLEENNINQTEQKLAIIKSFAFLRDNNLPLTESLVDKTALFFAQKNTSEFASSSAKNEFISEVKLDENKIISKNDITIDLSKDNKIAESLKEFSSKADQVISLFNKIGGENEDKAAAEILGQKIVNLQQTEQNSPLLLALEIPVQFKDFDKISSLLLKINKDNADPKINGSNESGFNITFILELPRLGIIKSTVEVDNKKIKNIFFTQSKDTAFLIEKHFSKLKANLENQGFNVEELDINIVESGLEDKKEFFNNIILSKMTETGSTEGKYTHIDIKV